MYWSRGPWPGDAVVFDAQVLALNTARPNLEFREFGGDFCSVTHT